MFVPHQIGDFWSEIYLFTFEYSKGQNMNE